jgi:hypothetical protein
MVLHLGHFVHNPSGISRFLDLAAPSLGFLVKLVVVVDAGGGVTAGSLVSSPSDFLVNEVVAISAEPNLLWQFEQEAYSLRVRFKVIGKFSRYCLVVRIGTPLNMRREPLTPTLSPLRRGEGDEAQIKHLTITWNRTPLFISGRLEC